MTNTDSFPDRARCVVIGGGVGGASVLHHLHKLGWTDSVLVEQHNLTEGTTWHSAGFVGQLRSTISQTRMIMYSSELYAELAAAGHDPGWRPVGGMRVATTPERVQELQRAASTARTYGLELELESPEEAKARLPLLETSDVLASAWMPGDGYLDPELLVRALLADLDDAVFTCTRVTGIEVAGGRVSGVVTDRGTIETEVVVNAAGAAAGVVGALAGVPIPIVPMRHQYVVTEPLDPPLDEIPTVRDPDHIVYARPENGALLVGGYAREPNAYDDAAPLSEPRQLFGEDAARFAESWEAAQHRFPSIRGIGLAKVVNGPEAFTPDGEFLLGETSLPGLWIAAGFCVHGLAGAGGVGKSTAEWIACGQPELDMSGMDIRRFGPQFASRSYARTRALDSYSRYYDVVYPHEEREAGRPLRKSPAWGRLDALGTAWGEKAGWERPNWVGANAAAGDESLRPRGWAGRFWSPAIAAECIATRDAACLFDQSSFSKIDVRGPGALAALQWLCANDIDKPDGSLIYTQLCNARGGIEADLTVTRISGHHFRVTTGTALGVRDRQWMLRNMPDRTGLAIDDRTGAEACFCLWGPEARTILQPLTDTDLSTDAFPFLTSQQLLVGAVPVRAQRVTFVGELGWELYCPAEYGHTLWDLLWEAGAPSGLVAGGYRAIDSMRLEKGYRVWGTDLDPNTTPYEAGLGFAVRLGKEGGFLGREALEAQKEAGVDTRLRCLVLDDPLAIVLGNEPVRSGDDLIGRVTSGGPGYRVGASIAVAKVAAGVEPGDRVEVGMFGEWATATVAQEPLYDPHGELTRA
ncbi:MAG: FAD-dependent oxidoreductase [Baekduia sp.]